MTDDDFESRVLGFEQERRRGGPREFAAFLDRPPASQGQERRRVADDGLVALDLGEVVVHALRALAAARAQVHADAVAAHHVQPGAEAGVAAEGVDAGEGPHQGLLGDVLGLVEVADRLGRSPVDALAQRPDELGEGRFVTGPRPLEQLGLVLAHFVPLVHGRSPGQGESRTQNLMSPETTPRLTAFPIRWGLPEIGAGRRMPSNHGLPARPGYTARRRGGRWRSDESSTTRREAAMSDDDPPIHILLAEDDDNDVRITRRAIKKGGLSATISVARDGQEALDILFRRPPHEDAARPDLVLLDINLPKINGVEVLRTVKQDDLLAAIPVLMLTTSARQEDVTTAYALGANTYICKPIRFARFVEVIRAVSTYWSRVARVPRLP